MIRLTGEVTYQDGRTEPVEVMQGEFAAWELYAIRAGLPVQPNQAPPVLMLRYLGYAGTHRGQPRSDWPAFEEWDAAVTNVDLEGDVDAATAETQVFPTVRSAG